MKKITSIAILLLFTLTTYSQSEMDKFIDELMSKMTLQEKLGQLNQLSADQLQTGVPQLKSRVGQQIVAGQVGSVFNVKGIDNIRALQELAVKNSRLGIPLIVAMDVIHGYETLFPVPIGMASTWDMQAIEQSAHIAAVEARANGIAWTFSPMVDIAPDSRWGRQAEGAGEDPFLGSQVAAAMVRGYQGKDLGSIESMAACVKHFALYGASEAGLDYSYVDMSRTRMYNQFLAPYKSAVEAGAATIMTSYNTIDHVPASINSWLLGDLLRGEWNFRGMVVTDYGTLSDLNIYGIGTPYENTMRAIKAGVDMDMVTQYFRTQLEKAVNNGDLGMEEIDRSCRRVLELKYRLGLFEDPYRGLDTRYADKKTYSKEHRSIARRLTAESFVLLKNEGDILPLKKSGTIALIGPLTNSRSDIAGCWSISKADEKYPTLKEAFQRALKGKARLLTSQGCNFLDNEQVQNAIADGHACKRIPRVDEAQANAEALSMAQEADIILCAMGEMAWMSGEGASRADLSLPAPQRRLLEKLLATGKPVVLLNFAGRATDLSWENDRCNAIMNVWYGSECGDALTDVLFGETEPGGRLVVSMPRSAGQEPLYYNHSTASREQSYKDKNYHVWSSTRVETGNDALYPFGYGLGYTTFSYSPVRLSAAEMTKEGTITATISVTNTGKREGSEVVQLYVHDVRASQVRPLRELKGFQRITLRQGESRDVSFSIDASMLSFYNTQQQLVCEPGEFEIFLGPDCRTENKATFILR